jgi:DtxR family transcriptional regulator, Mn-dependent transcriptional regulator
VAAILGDPEIDPHGHAIPQKDGAGVYRDEVPLMRWPLGTPAVISSVSDRSSSALRELERLGLVPGASLIVERRNAEEKDVEKKNAAESLGIRLEGRAEALRLNQQLASFIRVARGR